MSKKLNSWVKIETIAYLKVVCFGFLFSVLFANCNGKDDKNKVVEPTASVVNDTEPDPGQDLSDTATKINWLIYPGWDTITFTSSVDDKMKFNEEMENIRYYVRGALAGYNAVKAQEHRPGFIPYVVEDFKYGLKSKDPLRYTLVAFLKPPVEKPPRDDDGPGGHLIPPTPHPPGGK